MVKSLGAVLFVALVLSGCVEFNPKVTQVQVTSEATQLLPSARTTLTALVFGEGPFNSDVSWSVTGGGEISPTTGSSAEYTAPEVVLEDTEVTVTATSVQTPARSASVTLTLKAAASITAVQVTAARSELFAQESVALEASVTGSSSFSSEVTWSVEGGGSLSATTGPQVVYTAPDVVSADTPVTVTATSVQMPSRSASTTLTLKAPLITAVQVTAAHTELVEKESVALDALVTGAGSFSSEVTWSVEGIGSLSATTGSQVIYTAPDAIGADTQVTVTATSVADGSKAGSVTLVLRAPFVSAVELSAARPQLYAGNSVVFSATLVGAAPFGSKVEWKLVGSGVLEPLPNDASRSNMRFARYTAPRTPSALTATVQVTSVYDPTKSNSKSVQVLPLPLSITEVSSGTGSNRPGWLELRNLTSAPIQLADYALRARGFDTSTNSWVFKDVMLFPLPSRLLAPGAYIVVSGKAFPWENFDSNQMIWLRAEPALVPLWSGTTFIELVRSDIGETVDFVRFGASTQAPLSEGAWTGTSNVPTLPADGSSSLSFVRVTGANDTNGSSDWSSRVFATPAGPNDVPAGAVDDDSDGIPDSAEVAGGRFAGLDLYSMGARTAQRDLFIEVDHMQSTNPIILPQKEALDKVVALFARRGIQVHLDVGTRFSTSFNPAKYNLNQGSPEVPFASSINMTRAGGEAASVYELKSAYMDFARRAAFHYCVFGSTQTVSGTATGNSGNAERLGNDFLVSLSAFKLSTDSAAQRNQIINYQAAVFMHELGHNLGLRHGGNVDTNLKPNYLSVMNQLYELEGLGPISGSAAGDRYYLRNRLKGYDGVDDLADSPLSSTFVLDYSDGSGGVINETALNESAGMCRPGATSIDYDNSGTISTTTFDVNRDSVFEVLYDHNDWASIVLPFSLSHSVVRNLAPHDAPFEPISVVQDQQPVVDEEPPSPALLWNIP